jgi:hypothetical protein
MNYDEIVDKVACCACQGTIDYPNMIKIPFKARWLYPNIEGYMVAILCNDCVEQNCSIRYVVEFQGEVVIYHEI